MIKQNQLKKLIAPKNLVIYKNNPWKNENEYFDNAYNKLGSIKLLLNKRNDKIDEIINSLDKEQRKIIKEIREKLSKKEDRASNFIETLKNYFNIKDKNLMK